MDIGFSCCVNNFPRIVTRWRWTCLAAGIVRHWGQIGQVTITHHILRALNSPRRSSGSLREGVLPLELVSSLYTGWRLYFAALKHCHIRMKKTLSLYSRIAAQLRVVFSTRQLGATLTSQLRKISSYEEPPHTVISGASDTVIREDWLRNGHVWVITDERARASIFSRGEYTSSLALQ